MRYRRVNNNRVLRARLMKKKTVEGLDQMKKVFDYSVMIQFMMVIKLYYYKNKQS